MTDAFRAEQLQIVEVTDEQSDAEISPDGRYRYWLTRVWEPEAPMMLWIMLNPSTADHTLDDQTIRKCKGYAERAGCGGIKVVNLFPLRARDPSELLNWLDTVADAKNRATLESAIREAVERDELIVVGWGTWFTNHRRKMFTQVRPPIETFAAEAGARLDCIGTTANGSPKHPCMGAYHELVVW